LRPEGLPLEITYDGSTEAPVDAGKYLVTARAIIDGEAISASEYLEVKKALAQPSISNSPIMERKKG